MLRIFKKITTTVTALAILSSSALANDKFASFGLNLSTTGFGAEARTPITSRIYGRIGTNYFKYTHKASGNDFIKFKGGKIDLKGTINLFSVPIMVDFHPFDSSGFRLSLGVAYNSNNIKAEGDAKNGVTLNGRFFTAQQIGSVRAELSLGNAMSGVASIGYDSSFIKDTPISFHFELGAMYTGKPKLSVTSTGTGGTLALANIRKDIDEGFDKVKKYLEFYPIIKIGLKYTI
jgi:hypothetical protein